MERRLYLPSNSIIALTRWLAHEISTALPMSFDYRFPIALVGIAEGGLPFTKLLSAFLEVPHELTFLRRDAGGSFLLPLEIPLKQIILADCIFDTGKTFLEASDLLNSKGAMTRGAVLLMRGRDLDISLRYPQHVGFWVPGNEFFVGFGLDDKEGKSRELPDIYTEGEI